MYAHYIVSYTYLYGVPKKKKYFPGRPNMFSVPTTCLGLRFTSPRAPGFAVSQMGCIRVVQDLALWLGTLCYIIQGTNVWLANLWLIYGSHKNDGLSTWNQH